MEFNGTYIEGINLLDDAVKEVVKESAHISRQDDPRKMTAAITVTVKTLKSDILEWCQDCLNAYGINVDNFNSCWADGLALCALVHTLCPKEFDYFALKEKEDRKQLLETTLKVARDKLDLETEINGDDWSKLGKRPDSMLIFKLVNQLYFKERKLRKLRKFPLDKPENPEA